MVSNSTNPANIYFDILCPSVGSSSIHIALAGVDNLQAFPYSPSSNPQVVNTGVYWSLPSSSYSGSLRLEYDVDCGHVVQFVIFTKTCYSYRIFPNPAKGQLVVQKTSGKQSQDVTANDIPNDEIKLKLHNKFGEVVLLKTSKKLETTLNTKALPNGLYYLNITDIKGNVVREQVIIEH